MYIFFENINDLFSNVCLKINCKQTLLLAFMESQCSSQKMTKKSRLFSHTLLQIKVKTSPFHCATITPCAGEEAEPPRLGCACGVSSLSSLPAGVECLPLHSTIELK